MVHRKDLTVLQGADWSDTFTVRNSDGSVLDLTGYSARMAVREGGPSGSRVAYLSTGSDAVNGSISLGGATGVITTSMTAVQTSDLYAHLDLTRVPDQQKYVHFVYDLELISAAGTISRALMGRFIVSKEVTW